MNGVELYDYWRSSASYRVRIALNLADIAYDSIAVDLLKREHKSAEHLARNPQGLVPALLIDGHLFTQSLAIVEYLDETRKLKLLPAEPVARAQVRSLAYAVAMDIHPVCNMGIVAHVVKLIEGGDAVRQDWMQKFIGEGLAAVELLLQKTPGLLCYGDDPSLADLCLLPQVYNARRWAVDISGLARVSEIAAALERHPGFASAHPDRHLPASKRATP